MQITSNLFTRSINFVRSTIFFSKFISKGSLCFDVGANVGDRTSIFLRLGAAVVAIEPQADCVELMKNRFKKNKNFRVEQIAISYKVEELEFYLANKNQCSTLSTEFMTVYGKKDFLEWNKKVVVKTTTLDLLVSKYGIPDFCKIDVEDYELSVIKGLNSKIPVIAFEFNHPFIYNTIECIQLLKQKGYHQFNYIYFAKFSFQNNTWLTDNEMIEILKNLPPSIATGEIFAK